MRNDVLNSSAATKHRGTSAIDSTCVRLRALSLAAADGDALGSEESLRANLGVARPTMRQAARILEREGLIRVRRGPNGGYFATRPDAPVIEQAVAAYLQERSINLDDVLLIADLLWPEAVRRAALANPGADQLAEIGQLIECASIQLDHASFTKLEKQIDRLLLKLAGSSYIELILDINLAFFRAQSQRHPIISAQFIREWKRARFLELQAIREADAEFACFAGKRFRTFFHSWLMSNADANENDKFEDHRMQPVACAVDEHGQEGI